MLLALTFLFCSRLVALAHIQRAPEADSCASRWGFWLTAVNGTFEEGLAGCGEMGLAMAPIWTGESIDDPVNPVLRYMAGRVAEECKLDMFWIDRGLYSSGMIVTDLAMVEGGYKALCYEPSLPHPNNVEPAQSVYVTKTETTTNIVTRLFDIGIVVTETEVAEPVTTVYTSLTKTETTWTTLTFSIPTSVRYANLFWNTVIETDTLTMTVTEGTSTMVRTLSLTVTTSVIAVTSDVLTVTSTLRCPTKATPKAPVQSVPPEPVPVVHAAKRMICEKYSSLSALKVCDSTDEDFGLVMITTPNDFGTAGCVCAEMGLRLADLSDTVLLAQAKRILSQCSDLPDQKAWAGRINGKELTQVCMAVGKSPDSDGPVACIQELPVVCQE